MTRRVGILGGTFDPIHRGHLDAGAVAQRALNLDQILVVPSNLPPHRPQPVASSYHRFAMAALAVAELRDWRVSDAELLDPNPSYTAATLRRFHAGGLNAHELFFITGADAFVEIDTWKDYPGLLDLAHFAVISRPGAAIDDLSRLLPALAPRMERVTAAWSWSPQLNAVGQITSFVGPRILLIEGRTADASSTTIRSRLFAGQSIADLVTLSVQQHIERHGLYARNAGAPGVSGGQPDSPAGSMHGQD